MRRFNPEKELSKIRNGNKKKIIISICSLLVVGILGYSFALYQVRQTQKLAFNTVSEFKKRDIYLSVLVDGETQNEFPNQEDGYAFSGYECDGDATVTFDPDKWMASVNSNGPDKCTIKFGAKNINYDTLRIKEDILVDETNDVNLRYVGADPSNYIWFNCSKYDDLTNENAEDEEHQCERWRIIGLMNNMTIVDEDTDAETPNQSLIKIRRATKIGNIVWDNKGESGLNDWTKSSLQKGLNEIYLKNIDNGEWITSEEYSHTHSKNSKSPDYKGVTTNTEKMIEKVIWNLGSWNNDVVLATDFYTYERGEKAYNSQSTIWNGKIGLIYPSDYGLAVNGENNKREECLKIDLYHWQYNDCQQNSWIYDSGDHQWTLMPSSLNSTYIYDALLNGAVNSNRAYNMYNVRPTLYLKPNVKILDGEGTNEKPYIINVE